MSKVRLNYLLSTLYQILRVVCPIITAPYVSRVLGPEGIGIYSYTWSYSAYFTMLATLGTINYGAIEIAKKRDDIHLRSKLFFEIEVLTILTSLFSLFLWGIWILFHQQYYIYYLILSFNILAVVFDIAWFYAGLEEFKYSISQNSIFKLLSVIAIFIFVKDKNDLWIYILILSLSTLLANFSMWLYLPRFITYKDLGRLKLSEHLKGTLVFFIPTIATSVYTVLDKTLIGLITKDAYENGYYEQAMRIISLTQAVTFYGLNSVLTSHISYLFSKDSFEEIKKRIQTSIDYILTIAIGGFAGLVGIAYHFVPAFFGPNYDKTIYLLQILSVLLLIQGISNCLGAQYYNPAGLRSKSAKYIIIGAIINLILNIILIPRYLSLGAAIASVCAELLIMVLYIINCREFVDAFSIIKKAAPKKVFSGIVMLLVVISLSSLIDNNYIATLVELIIGITVYLTLLIIQKDTFVMNFIIPILNKALKRK